MASELIKIITLNNKMSELAKLYTNVQVFILYFLGAILIGLGITSPKKPKSQSRPNLIMTGLFFILSAILVTFLRNRYSKFDDYFTVLGIMS